MVHGNFSVIDLEAWVNCKDKEAIASEWNKALHKEGFVYLINHGVQSSYHEVFKEWQEFFLLPVDEKLKYAAERYGKMGYNCPGKETVSLSIAKDGPLESSSIKPDPVESLESGGSSSFVGNFPSSAHGYFRGDKLRDACSELYKTLDEKVLKPCLDISTIALDIPDESFRKLWFTEGPGANVMRLAKYLPREDDLLINEVLYGEHTDYDGLTFLWRNQTNGLQAFLNDQWVDVPLLNEHPDALVVNVGDLLSFWTRKYWHSPLHRVLRHSSEKKSTSSPLVSIVFFAGPHKDTRLVPINSYLLPDCQDAPLFITAGEHVAMKIAKTAN